MERTCEANAAGENSSFIFTVRVKSVPLCHFKLAHVLYIWLSKNFSKPTSKNGEIGRFDRSLLYRVVSADFQISLTHSI